MFVHARYPPSFLLCFMPTQVLVLNTAPIYMRRLQRLPRRPQWAAPTVQRCCMSNAPADEEVSRAFKTLGVPKGAPFADLKRKYLHLAKEHHPDVQSASNKNSTENMSSINEAYDVLSRAHKAGTLPTGSTHHPRTPHSSAGAYGYQPIWEDMPTEFYEGMWAEMQHDFQQQQQRQDRRRWDPRRAFMMDDDDEGYRPENHQQSSERRKPPREGPNDHRKDQRATTTTWKASDLDALTNMYQDGRSFEFIANALGKTKDEVVVEFNRWCNDQSKGQRGRGGYRGARRGSGRGRASSMYSAMDYEDIADAFYDPEAFNEHGEPLEVHFFTNVDDDVHPFVGTHSMHRGGRGGGRRHAPRHSRGRGGGGPPRYQR